MYSVVQASARLVTFAPKIVPFGNWNRSLIGRILPILALAIATGSVVAAPPFVAGYDRFAGSQPIQAGRVLLSELSCTACHAVDHETLKPKKGPTLVSAGQRLQMDWLSPAGITVLSEVADFLGIKFTHRL